MKPTRSLIILAMTMALVAPCQAAPQTLKDVQASNLRTFTHRKLNLTVFQADFQLPPGEWEIDNRAALKGLKHIQWEVPAEQREERGNRYYKAKGEMVQRHINSMYWGINQYAVQHADYGFTLKDFDGDVQALKQLIKSITAELDLPLPTVSTAAQALEWLNTSVTPYQVYFKYMDRGQFRYPNYNVFGEIQQLFKLKKIEDLNDAHMEELVGTAVGKRFKRMILIHRYKLDWLQAQSPRLIGPEKIEDLDEYQRKLYYRQISDTSYEPLKETKDPQYFIIPIVDIKQGNNKHKLPLVLELHPLVDDGKHWVLYNNGTSERVTMDPQLLQKYQVSVVPKLEQPQNTRQNYHFLAQLEHQARGPWTIIFKNKFSGQTMNATLALNQAAPRDPKAFQTWSALRAQQWARQYSVAPSTVLLTWLGRYPDIYGDKLPKIVDSMDRRNRRGRTTSVLNMLGGRAAIEETLQMTNLNVTSSGNQKEQATVPLNSIEGVKVKAHDYATLLAGQAGGSLELANYVPHDRFFVYFAQPGALATYLEDGVDFVHQFGGDLFGNRLNYDLKNRYYSRLGLDAKWVDQLLKSGFVSEAALILPDLFFIDGTDMTMVVKVPKLGLLSPLLRLIGVGGLKQGEVLEKQLENGQKVYWSAQGPFLLVSTHADEIGKVLELVKNKGKGSLGQSAEFRYMLTQMPLKEETKVFTYFSDPFIRRMTGPEVKIAQFRRLQERAKLEMITAGALLYQNDGHMEAPTMERLARLGYIPKELLNAGYQLHADLIAASTELGTARDLKTILDMDLSAVFHKEAEAYKSYVTNYSRFWRQFFDPIAIRYDKSSDASSEINVFILPLIESTIYDGARQVLNGFEKGKQMPHPVFTPSPVMTISANINEETWVHVVKAFSFLKKYTTLDPEIFDQFGPSLHVVVADADPVINLGSGDFLGLMGTGGASQVFRARESLWMPIAFMMFTRPTKLMFELKDEDKVRRFLRTVSSLREWEMPRGWGETMVEFTQVEEKDEWNCRIGLFGVMSLRYGVRVQDGYLVFSNVPWSQQYQMAFSEEETLNSTVVSMYPGAAKQQMAGLYNSALERMGAANRRSLVYLTPLVDINDGDIDRALAQHKLLFGFTPMHVGRGEWELQNGRLRSTTFGGLWDRHQPDYLKDDEDFGLLRKFHDLSVSMQFEDEGLRTKIRWTPRRK